MKKVLLITNHSYMFWQFRRELAAHLLKDYEVLLSTPFVGHEEDFANMGIKMIRTDFERRSISLTKDGKLLRTYKELLKKEQPDMVVTYSIKPNIYAGMACKKLGIPYCVNVQGLGTAFQKKGMAQVVTILYRMALKKAKTVFFENEANAQLFLEKNIISKEQCVVLPGAGINLDFHQVQPYPEQEKVHFLYLSRLMKEKGIDELLYAVHKLHENYSGQFVWDIVGFFEDEYKEPVEELVEKGIAVFHGFQTDPRPFYGMADCVVLPSHHEGMSNVLLEGAATGRMLITSDIPGCLEAVEEGINGLLVTVKDGEALYQAMERCLHMTAEQRKEMGLAGRRKMEQEFCKEMVVEKTVKAIFE